MTQLNEANLDLPILSTDSVHVWSVSLAVEAAHTRDLARLLSDDEQQRAARFYHSRDRLYFIARWGAARILAGHYLDIHPREVRFEYSLYGKPRIAPDLEPRGLEFSLAHSGEMALYAFARNRAIGVDIEHVRPLPDMLDVARGVFSPRENQALSALPEAERLVAFYHCWTRKEAYLKARGEGLTSRLAEFDVSLIPGEPARLLDVKGNAAEVDRWSLSALAPAPNYVAALAVEGHGWHLSERRWSVAGQSQGALGEAETD